MDHLIRGGRHQRLVSASNAASRERPKADINNEERSHTDNSNLIGQPTKKDWSELHKASGLDDDNDNIISSSSVVVNNKGILPREIYYNRESTKKLAKPEQASIEEKTSQTLANGVDMASNERLTMLEEPIARQRNAAKRLLGGTHLPISSSAGSSSLDSNRSRQTMQQTSRDNQYPIKPPLFAATSDQQTLLAPVNSTNSQQLLILTFFGGFVTFLLFLLLALILHNWFFARRKRRHLAGGKWWLRMWPITRSRSQQRPTTCEDSPGKISSVLNEDFGCVSGERVQLVERRPMKPSSDETHDDKGMSGEHLLRSSPLEDEQDMISEARLERIQTATVPSDRDEKRSSTMVILRRKLANNSFLSYGRPKVRLIGECVRKFIDEEAEEMRTRQAKISSASNLSWRNRLPAYFSKTREISSNEVAVDIGEPTANDSDLNTTNKNDNEHTNASTPVQVGSTATGELINGSDRVSAISSSGQTGDNVINPDSVTTSPGLVDQRLLLAAGEQQATVKLTNNSPTIFNDTCSSTSLFSASPNVFADSSSNPASQNNDSSPWPCNALDWQQLRSRAAQKDFFGASRDGCNSGLDYLRSKSHTNTPMQCYNPTGGPQAVCRPCCASVSPSALNQTTSSEQICCQQQQQLTYQTTSSFSNNNNNKPRAIDLLQLGNAADANFYRAETGADKYSCSDRSRGLSNHLRRQYENYYDDEQDDAYRRLTANIGMDFELGFNHHHNHHHHSVSALNYYATEGASTHLNNVLHLAPTCKAPTCLQHLNHGRLNEQHPLLVPPNLPEQNQASPDMLHHHDQQYHQPRGAIQEDYSCCQPRADQASFAQTCEISDKLPFNPPQRQRSCSDQQQMPNTSDTGYLFKIDGGSAGELLTSSASTSLGGSDSGFMLPNGQLVYSNMLRQQAVCSNPLCACQVAGSAGPSAQQVAPANLPVGPPMSIVIQQPSMATPPPPLLNQSTDNSAGASPIDQARLSEAASGDKVIKQDGYNKQEVPSDISNNSSKINEASLGISMGNNNSLPSGSKSTSPTIIRPRWKHRRYQLNQKRQTDLSASCAPSHPNNLIPRRVSIAGDQLSVRTITNSAINSRDASSSPASQQQPLLFQHRASLASEGGWPQENQLRFNQNQHRYQHHLQQQQQQQHYHRHSEAPQSDHSHRPSDASLYDPQSCATKSSYSSSNGSSSGICISGSTCATNTPTTGVFPYSSFATNFSKTDQDELATHLNLANAPTTALCNAYTLQQFSNSPYQLSMNQMMAAQHLMTDLTSTESSGCHIQASASRKYSLPVQLETTHSVERLSPGDCANRLLFERNLQRVDSFNLNPSAAQASQVHYLQNDRILPGSAVVAHIGAHRQQLDANSQRIEQQRRQLEGSRRGSQTITRQSSFWHEDDSIDSIFSLATSGIAGLQSNDGSQFDVNNLQLDEKDIHSKEECCNMDQQQAAQRRGSNQRPSISSLVLSGDSIESIKLRPTAAGDADQAESPRQDDPVGDPVGLASADNSRPLPGSSSQPKQSRSSESRNSHAQKSGIAHLRNRLSSSSITSSTTSSPSPDSSRPSERILGIAPKSSSISKRHNFSKIRAGRRHSRLGGNSGSTNIDASSKTDENRRTKAKSRQSSSPRSASKPKDDCDDPELDQKQNSNEKPDSMLIDRAFASKYRFLMRT